MRWVKYCSKLSSKLKKNSEDAILARSLKNFRRNLMITKIGKFRKSKFLRKVYFKLVCKEKEGRINKWKEQ